MQKPGGIELANRWVRLRPIRLEEAPAYLEIGRAPEIWRYLTPRPFERVADAERWILAMQDRSQRHGDVTFSVYDLESGRLAGSTSFLEVRPEHAGLEIGFTWYGTDFWRSHVNTATKLALLTHAFEVLGANRVQLQTDLRNQNSQRAIARLGAQREGVLRRHKVYPDGYVRDSVMFSVIVDEWPAVKQGLLDKLDR